MNKPVDLLVKVGVESYSLPQMLSEYSKWGMSKRLSNTAIPVDRIVPLVSRAFIWFPEVLPMVQAEGKTLKELTEYMVEKGYLSEIDAAYWELYEEWKPVDSLQPDSYVPTHILHLACRIQDQEPKVRGEIERLFKIKWHAAVVAYSTLGKIQFTTGDDGSVPKDIIDQFGNSIEYVQIEYVEQDK